MRIGILAYDQCTTSMIFGVMDILVFANKQYKAQTGKELFEVEIITESGHPVSSFSQYTLHPRRNINTKIHYDIVYIPGFLGQLDDILENHTNLIRWIGRLRTKETIVTAACNGNFLLAESGLLKSKKATTHWSLIAEFKARYRDIILEPEKIIVDNGHIISAAGVTAYFNLALFLIERYGSKELALTTAKVFLVDSGRKIQTPYQMYQMTRNHGDDDILQVQDWLERNYGEKITLDEMTNVCNLGKKTLIRRFKKVTGDTPLIYLQKLRIENAKRILESKSLSFNEITWEVGYSDVSSFHKAFKSETGLTPMEYRSKFSFV